MIYPVSWSTFELSFLRIAMEWHPERTTRTFPADIIFVLSDINAEAINRYEAKTMILVDIGFL
jgi:hypothetical protein